MNSSWLKYAEEAVLCFGSKKRQWLSCKHGAAPGSRGAPSCADPEAVPAGEDL